MMLHGRLLTNVMKNKMKLSHAMCNYCGNGEETILHAMRDCPKAKVLWRCFKPMNHSAQFYTVDIFQWININLYNTIQWQGKGSWCDVWALSCHCLWSWRNKEMFEDEFVRPVYPAQHVLQMVEDYKGATTTNDIVTLKNQQISLIGWRPPKDMFVRLNTDGAYKEQVVVAVEDCYGEAKENG
ncbi:ribonuclease H [Trifolium medium]|uniref:Ribonuclease H n=1 Tax=Trifolium medium TaxID=97028 RepID=A0A392NX45_9FABA|nr:ribonuclease H [Trifolium medium]